jgi:hypothetical protein
MGALDNSRRRCFDGGGNAAQKGTFILPDRLL